MIIGAVCFLVWSILAKPDSLYIPMGLLVLSAFNTQFRSRVMGWGIFALAFGVFITVLGAFTLTIRVNPLVPWLTYSFSLTGFLALSIVGLYQLRPQKGEPKNEKPA